MDAGKIKVDVNVTKKYVVVHESIMQSLIKDAGTFCIAAGLIGIGVIIDSTAMQWFGALVAMLIIIGKAMRNRSQEVGVTEFYSPEDARAFLDAIVLKKNKE